MQKPIPCLCQIKSSKCFNNLLVSFTINNNISAIYFCFLFWAQIPAIVQSTENLPVVWVCSFLTPTPQASSLPYGFYRVRAIRKHLPHAYTSRAILSFTIAYILFIHLKHKAKLANNIPKQTLRFQSLFDIPFPLANTTSIV